MAQESDVESAPPDPDSEQWSREELLLAKVHDEIQMLRWLYSSAHTERPLQWKPEPIPRPGVVNPHERKKPSAAETGLLAAHLARTQGGADTTYN